MTGAPERQRSRGAAALEERLAAAGIGPVHVSASGAGSPQSSGGPVADMNDARLHGTHVHVVPPTSLHGVPAQSAKDAGWLAAPRAAALARLRAMGLPGRRDEYWRYTDPTALNAATAPPSVPLASDDADVFEGVDCLRLIFVDGVFDSAASDPLALAGVEIDRLRAAAPRDIHWAQGLYGTLEARGQSPVSRPFAALNSAAATDGVLIRVTAAAARPVALIHRHGDAGSDATLHHCIRVEPGAVLTLLESGVGAARLNSVAEVDIADGGTVHHVRVQGREHGRHAVTHLFARIGARAVLKSFTLTMNGALTRNEAVIEIAGEAAVAHIAGAAVGDSGCLQDDTVFITHSAPDCESRQVFKKVLRGGAAGVFQGKILVQPQAQKTDGYQISQALLLDEDCQFLAKPELEIYADDVKCSHGSTSGAIDPTALFYLRSRGVPLAEAQVLLVLSFLADALAEIDDPALAAVIAAELEGWLARRRR